MKKSRLATALESGALELPENGRIGAFLPEPGEDLSMLDQGRAEIIHGFRPAHDYWRGQGFSVRPEPGGPYAAAIVFVPRAKALARGLIAAATKLTEPGGPVIVDGQKGDGIDSLYKSLRRALPLSEALSKAHGKLFHFISGEGARAALPLAAGATMPEGFFTTAGVFSAERADPGSEMLAEALPERLSGRVADLGAGWGYLARAVLERPGVEALDLVEADHAALECARRNIGDARARFHWADARRWQPEKLLDAVITNPPFHEGRAADPGLGREFIAAAARMLKPSGHLYMVANRHLPYEAALRAHFRQVEELPGDGRYKLFHAARPARDRSARKGC